MRQHFNLRFFSILFFCSISAVFLTFFFHAQKTEPHIALMVGRFQPLHNGHLRDIKLMLQENDTVIIGIGSYQLTERSKRNPFLPAERYKMLLVIAEKLKQKPEGKEIFIVPLADIDSAATFTEKPDNDRWITHVLNEIKTAKLPIPTDYYTGSKEDAFFYLSYFANPEKSTGRRLHIVDRHDGEDISATKVRAAITKDFIDPTNSTFGLWKQFVPEELHLLVEEYSELAKDVLTE